MPADPRRTPLAPEQVVERLAQAAGVPTRDGLLAYDRELAPGVRLVALDTADRAGGSDGTLPADELDWLAETLRAHAGEHLLIASATPLEETRGGDAALELLDRARASSQCSRATRTGRRSGRAARPTAATGWCAPRR